MRLKTPILDHDPGIGGRYSVLSNVGLLPAMLAGLDVAALREGAGETLDAALSASDAARQRAGARRGDQRRACRSSTASARR